MTKTFIRTFALAAALGVAACGDDPLTATGDTLTEAEAVDLAEVLLSNASFFGAAGPAAVDGPQLAPFSYNLNVDETEPCELGGTVRVTGSATISGDDATEAFSLQYDVTSAHSNCGLAADSGREFTLTSSLEMGFGAESTGAGDFSWDGGASGSVTWSSDGKSGTCPVNYTFTGDITGQTMTATMSGNVCGRTISQEFTYGAP